MEEMADLGQIGSLNSGRNWWAAELKNLKNHWMK
jgi:hypothetical protein